MQTDKKISNSWHNKLLIFVMLFLYMPFAQKSRRENDNDETTLQATQLIVWLIKTPLECLSLFWIAHNVFKSYNFTFFTSVAFALIGIVAWEFVIHNVFHLNRLVYEQLKGKRVPQKAENIALVAPGLSMFLGLLSGLVIIFWLCLFTLYGAFVIFELSW